MKFYTSGELATISRMREHGYGWRDVAERTGRPYASLRQTKHRAKKPIDHRQSETETMIAEFEAGKTLAEIASARGWSLSRVCMRLTRAGYDAEMRYLTRPSPKSPTFPTRLPRD